MQDGSSDDDPRTDAPQVDATGRGAVDVRTTLPVEPPYLRSARYAWATVGLAGALIILGIVVGRLSLVVIPVVLALFPAALLMPVARWLKGRGMPPAAASLLTIVLLLATLTGIFAALGMSAADDIPALRSSLQAGLTDLEETIQEDPLGLGYDFPGFGVLFEQAGEQIAEAVNGEGQDGGDTADEGDGPDLASGAAGAAGTVTEALAGLLLLVVALFFYLKDEGRLADGIIATMPRRWHRHASALASRFWTTTGAYFRGQILVAFVDAVFIGLGLILLGVPLAIPLAVLVFFGALFPIIGAFISGGAAVLVALADSGPVRALVVLGLIVLVQQIEGNVLQPVIMSNAIALHPMVVILALTAGSVLLGILGAFLAVPVAAGVARALDYAREEMGEEAADPPRQIPAQT